MTNLRNNFPFLEAIIEQNWEEGIGLYKNSKEPYEKYEWAEGINYAREIFKVLLEHKYKRLFDKGKKYYRDDKLRKAKQKLKKAKHITDKYRWINKVKEQDKLLKTIEKNIIHPFRGLVE